MNNTRKARAKVSLFLELVQLWLPIVHELRDVSTTTERVNNFQDNVDQFAAHLTRSFPFECSEKMIYFHILRDHVYVILKFWFQTTGWGYGVFSSSSGEHLNKRLKVYEADHTNQSADRFRSTLFHFRVGMLLFPDILCKEVVSKVKCTACGAFRKNKACPSRVDSRAEQHLNLAESGED